MALILSTGYLVMLIKTFGTIGHDHQICVSFHIYSLLSMKCQKELIYYDYFNKTLLQRGSETAIILFHSDSVRKRLIIMRMAINL